MGIVFTNLAWEYRPGDLDALTVFSLQEGVRIRGSGYLWYLTRKRCGSLLLPALLGFTVLGSYAVIAGLLWVGFLGGVLAAVVVLQLGLGSLVLLGAASVPQVLVYVPAGFFFLTVVYRMSERSRLEGAAGRGKYREYLLACTAGMALIFCGVLAECLCKPVYSACGAGRLKKVTKNLQLFFLQDIVAASAEDFDILLKEEEKPRNA